MLIFIVKFDRISLGDIMNERNTLKSNNGFLEIGGVKAVDLAKEYGTPLYVFDREYVKQMCNVFSTSLKNEYEDYGFISYASKAFCCKEIYRIIKDYNLGCDVVSDGELFTALSTGFSSDNIIYHGNNKTKTELQNAVKNKVKYIVIDSEAEIDYLDYLCSEHNVAQEVLIRVNPGVEAHTHEFIQTAKTDSKFGFSISNGDAERFIKKVLSKKNLNLVGLHCHIGSQIFETESFVLAVEKMTDFYKYCKDVLNVEFSVLDLGGGFGIYYSGDDVKFKPSDYSLYVKVICEKLKECISNKGINKPFLILEPGRAIVGEAGITLYTVGSVKSIKDVKDYLSIDGGMFENPRFALYQAKYSVVSADKLDKENTHKYSIAGKCCESGDIIAENIYLPEINAGDVLAVLSTGAYNYSMASNYNRNLIPTVVMVENGKSKVIVKGQTIEDILRNDV